MNPVQLHLMLNHIPLVGIGFVILLLLIALLRRSSELITVSLIFVILVALWAIPAHRTGEAAEEFVEGLPGISEQLVQAHDKSADITFIFIEAVGALALVTLVIRRFNRQLGNRLSVFTLIGLIIAGGLIAWTANQGGKIHHGDLEVETTSPQTLPAESYKENKNGQ